MAEMSGAPRAMGSGARPLLPGHVLTRLLDATSAVRSELDLPTVLRHVIEAARTLVHAKSGALGVVDVDGDGPSQLVTVGSDRRAGPRRARRRGRRRHPQRTVVRAGPSR